MDLQEGSEPRVTTFPNDGRLSRTVVVTPTLS